MTMKWWMWLIGYFAIGLVFWARLAYEVGMHYGQMHHGEPEPACADAECRSPLRLLLAAFLFWPAFSVAFVVVKFTQIWTKAGSNSQLPPLNEARRTIETFASAQQQLLKEDLEKQIATENTTDAIVGGAQKLIDELRKGIEAGFEKRRDDMLNDAVIHHADPGPGSVHYVTWWKRRKTIEGRIHGFALIGERVALTLADGSDVFVDLSVLPFSAEEIKKEVGKNLLIRCDATLLDGPAPPEGKTT